MLTIAIIAFREFFEAFLLVGIFIGIDKKLNLGKRKEILLASLCGITLSLILPLIVFSFGQDVKAVLNENTTDTLEGYLLIFSGFFLVYVVFTLHTFMSSYRQKAVKYAKQKMEQKMFDISLFLTIVLFVAREGFEVALLVAATSVFSVFASNLEGLLLGFSSAGIIGILSSLGYSKISIKKIFTYTEYGIIIIGAAMVKNGISFLSVNYFHIHLDTLITLPLQFLPGESTVFGHVLNNLLGIERQMSLIQLSIMVGYFLLVNYLFKRTSQDK